MPIQRFLQRLVWAGVLPVFVLAVLLAATRLHDQHGAALEAGERAAVNLLRRIDSVVQGRQAALQMLAAGAADAGPEARARQYREAMAFHATFGSHVILADLERQMLFNTRVPWGTELPSLPAPEGPSATATARVTRRPAVGNLAMGPVARQMVLPVVVPVLAEGEAVAMLLTTIETRELQGLLDTWQAPAYVGVTLLDGTGRVIAHRPADTAHPESASPDAQAPAPTPARSRTLTSEFTPWSLVVQVDHAALLAQLVRTAVVLLAMLGLTVAFVAWAARRAGQRLTQAVSSLAAEPADAPQAPAPARDEEILEITLARQRLNALAGERARAEAEVRASESRLRQLLGGLREAVWISVDRRIAFANPAAERLVGISAGHMSGRTIFEFMQPESAARARQLLRLVRDGGSDVLFEGMRFADPDAPPRSLLVTGVSLALPDGQAMLTIARDVSELQQTRGALERSNRELVRLVGRLNTVEEEERRRIARELHDDLQQRLGVIVMEQQQAARTLPQPAPASTAALERAQAMTALAIDSVRRIVRSLRPQALDELGLTAALDVLLREWGEQDGLQAEYEPIGPEGADGAMPGAVASCLYRIAQEALTNVRKHAQASFVHVVLDLSRPGFATLSIADDGRGLPAGQPPGNHAFGISGMRERLQALGGRLVIDEPPGGGTRVRAQVSWPLA